MDSIVTGSVFHIPGDPEESRIETAVSNVEERRIGVDRVEVRPPKKNKGLGPQHCAALDVRGRTVQLVLRIH